MTFSLAQELLDPGCYKSGYAANTYDAGGIDMHISYNEADRR